MASKRDVLILGAFIAVLGFEAVRGVREIQASMMEQERAEVPEADRTGCITVNPSSDDESVPIHPELSRAKAASADVNAVDPKVLEPRLLDDREEMKRYLETFPRDAYTVKDVPGLGRFFLDAGDDIIKNQLRAGIPWEPYVVRDLTRFVRKGTTAIDAGAHIGTHTLTLAQLVGKDGRVYAFEPQKKLFRELFYNLKENNADNAIALRYAVGDTPGVIEMTVPAGNEGGGQVGAVGVAGGDKAELRTIDSFGFKNVSLMKIDVEGFEDAVLRGAKETIMRDRPILFVEIQGGASFDIADPPLRKQIVDTIQLIESMDYHVIRTSRHDYLAVPLR